LRRKFSAEQAKPLGGMPSGMRSSEKTRHKQKTDRLYGTASSFGGSARIGRWKRAQQAVGARDKRRRLSGQAKYAAGRSSGTGGKRGGLRAFQAGALLRLSILP